MPFDWFVKNPDHFLGALFTVKSSVDVTTVTEEKIAGVKVGAIHFDFNKFAIKAAYRDELNKLGEFLKSHPKASAGDRRRDSRRPRRWRCRRLPPGFR